MGDNLADRVTRLERTNRWLVATAGIAVAGLLIAVATGAAGPPRTIEASEFVVKDEAGVTRAKLGLFGGDLPELALMDGQGKTRLTLSVEDEPRLSMFGPTGALQLLARSRPDGLAGITILGKDPKDLVGVMIDRDGVPGIHVTSKGKTTRLP